MINKEYLINELEKLIAEHDLQKSTPNTHKWHLLNNTKKYIDALKAADTPIDVKNAVTDYGMFCTESMDWDTELYKKSSALTEMGYKVARVNRL
jgi:hypothetical protein